MDLSARAGASDRVGCALGNGTSAFETRRRDIDSQYLLAGFARCAVCSGSFGVMSGSHRSARDRLYGCLAYLKRGTSVCGNSLRLPIERVDNGCSKR